MIPYLMASQQAPKHRFTIGFKLSHSNAYMLRSWTFTNQQLGIIVHDLYLLKALTEAHIMYIYS